MQEFGMQKYFWQLARHSKKCCKPKPVEKEKKYYQKDGVYVCCQCNKQFSHQSNIIRHTKKCGNKKQKQVYDCHKCEKSFSFKCRLTAHLKNHALICNVCNSKFRRPELFDQHIHVNAQERQMVIINGAVFL